MNSKKKVSYKDLALIAGNISKLYEEGIQLLHIFSLLDELPLKKEYKMLLKEMEIIIRDGGTLRKAFSKGEGLIPIFFLSMVGIGERTGRIAGLYAVRYCGDAGTISRERRSRNKSSMYD